MVKTDENRIQKSDRIEDAKKNETNSSNEIKRNNLAQAKVKKENTSKKIDTVACKTTDSLNKKKRKTGFSIKVTIYF